MNEEQGSQQKTPVGGRVKRCILCVTLMLAEAGIVYAAGDNQRHPADEGISNVLKYTHQYQREKGISFGKQKKLAYSERSGITENTELRHYLTMDEQELHQLKEEHQSLHGCLDAL
ncbi:hypothetical protein ACGI40_23165 [Escherichia coli]|nr:hypothetical protein [Escherichia coli]HAX0301787.1 hypothetical protein [Escherichia coli CD471]EFF0761645.1 hypothetical protein [Escherichia coli]EFJ8858604.1 hypothetical protein [Escherichia coli]EFK0006174.1 hypothetical protein [Escherichia coli]PSY46384.1 hypothetical protein C7B19_25775 [Escherichia coli]